MQKEMTKRLTAFYILLFLADAAAAGDAGVVARVFEKELIIPSGCTLNVRPSVLDKDIRFSCTFVSNGLVSADIYFKPSSACQSDTVESQDGVKEDFVISTNKINAHGSHRFLGPDGPTIHKRRIWDNEVCLLAVSGSGDLLDQLLGDLWK